MNLQVLNVPFIKTIHGYSGTAVNKNYGQTAFKLSERVWQAVKGNNLKNKGLNIWVYEPNEIVFAGVELEVDPGMDTDLEQKTIYLPKYAYYKHVGPYTLLKQVGIDLRNELKARGLETSFPDVEIYGHWSADETKLETELLMCLK